MALAFLERPRWTPATAWQTPTPQSPSANGFTTAGAGQYDKDATPTADVHPEDRQEILTRPGVQQCQAQGLVFCP